jgi:hypothetical protein
MKKIYFLLITVLITLNSYSQYSAVILKRFDFANPEDQFMTNISQDLRDMLRKIFIENNVDTLLINRINTRNGMFSNYTDKKYLLIHEHLIMRINKEQNGYKVINEYKSPGYFNKNKHTNLILFYCTNKYTKDNNDNIDRLYIYILD